MRNSIASLALQGLNLSYSISSRSYLERAKALLGKEDTPSLFYAAFELRCGIEARMSEYLEVQQHISAKKKLGWQVAKLAKNIEDAFRIGEKKAILVVLDSSGKETLVTAQYTPLRKAGQKIAQQLGDYMHKAKCNYPEDHEYWNRFRSILEQGVTELEFATTGILLGPPIMKSKTGDAFMYLEDNEQDLLEKMQKHKEIIFKIEYE